MSLMTERRSRLSAGTARSITKTRIIPQSMRSRVPRASQTRATTLRSSVPTIRSRLSASTARLVTGMPTRPGISMTPRPGISMTPRPGISMTPRPGISIARPLIPTGIIPTIIPTSTAQPGGGLPTPSVTGGWLGLGEIGGDIKAFGGNIIEQFKTLVPTAIKIIAAVVVIKIVLWLVKGRRR